jgi:tetratricopeptide (TPR) repeat protein
VRASASIVTRAGLVLVALAACAWLLAQYHDAQLTESVKRINNDPYSLPPDLRGALADAKRIGTLNPDPYEARAYRALVEVRLGQRTTAIRRLESVLADQPNYFEAWLLLNKVTAQTDPALSARALAHMRALDPRDVKP